MSIGIKHVHIGREIDKRRLELGISKSELGRRIHVPLAAHQPHSGERNHRHRQTYRYKCSLGEEFL